MHVVANAAVSVDGKLSTRLREQLTISGPEDFERVDRLRADVDAVMVGVGTVLADDPSLTVDDPALVAEREARGHPPQPVRVVADSQARTPADARILDDSAPTAVLVSGVVPDYQVAGFESGGATVVATGGERVDLPEALAELEGAGVERLLVEGGGELLYSMFADDLIDELSVYVGSLVVGGAEAPSLVDGKGFIEDFPALTLESIDRIDDGALLSYTVDAR